MFCVGGQPSLAYFTWIFWQVWCQCWLCRVFEVVTCLKVGCCRFFFHYRTPTLQVGCHLTTTCRPPLFSKLPPPNLSTSGTKIKCVIAWWIGALLIMEDGGCSLTFVNATNPNIIKVAAESPCITHPPNWSDCVADQKSKISVVLLGLLSPSLIKMIIECCQS
jgi:hypothetical protein